MYDYEDWNEINIGIIHESTEKCRYQVLKYMYLGTTKLSIQNKYISKDIYISII